jgi:hypothetical protein
MITWRKRKNVLLFFGLNAIGSELMELDMRSSVRRQTVYIHYAWYIVLWSGITNMATVRNVEDISSRFNIGYDYE